MALLQGRLEARRQARRPRVKTYGREEVVQLKDPGCSQNSSQAELSPGRIYFRSLKPAHNLSCFSIDSDNIESTGLGQRAGGLPLLQFERKAVKFERKENSSPKPRRTHRYPTASSEIYRKENEKVIRKISNKRICSVNCLREEESREKILKLSGIRRAKRHSKPCIVQRGGEELKTELQSYLEGEYKAKYPFSSVRECLDKMRLEDSQRPSKNMHYQTFFGLQPQFSTLQTYYARCLSEAPKMDNFDEDVYQPHRIPRIPTEKGLVRFIQEYVPFSKMVNIQALVIQNSFFVEYCPSQLYFGEVVEDQRQGRGILVTNRSCFEGEFRRNNKVRGVQVSPCGVYRGDFKDNKREGMGEFEWCNGETYVGSWKQGLRWGNGFWTNRGGDSYNGEWVKGKGYGYGSYLSEGRQYYGDFFDFKKDGWGRQTLPNGDSYEGGFQQGFPEGKGVYRWAKGTKYEGHFAKGLRTGSGVLTTLDNFIYEGSFMCEKAEGHCQILMPNGDTYQGCLRNGKKDGRGLLTLNKGQVKLDGYWKEDTFLTRRPS